MKKTFVTLLVSAVAVWGYVLVQIVFIMIGKTDAASDSVEDGLLPAAAMLVRARPALDTNFRDPFQSYLYAQKPAPPPSAKPAVAKAQLKAIDPPRAVINGILWGTEPVAILKQDGKTELVKAGGEIWDFKVLRIERNQVIVIKQGRQFTLEY
jgi:hypothetical protein